MRKTITLITTIFLFNVAFAQDYIPINLDSLIHFNKSYKIIKWTKEEVGQMDSLFRPLYYEGGVLIISKKDNFIQDTIFISDVTGVSREKYHTVTARYWYKNDKRIIPYFIENTCTPLNYFLGKSQRILGLRNEVIPRGCYPTVLGFKLKEEYINEYPDGLPKKKEIFSYSLPNIRSLTWKEWKLKEKHRTNQKIFDDFVYSDSEENLCYPYPPGYYSNYLEGDCEEMTKRQLTIKIQKALIARGYELEITGEMNSKTKAALSKFQKDNGLPSCGGEDMLLEALGIEY